MNRISTTLPGAAVPIGFAEDGNDLSIAFEKISAAVKTADPKKISEARDAMSQAISASKQPMAKMEPPEPTAPEDLNGAVLTVASFPTQQVQADIYSVMALLTELSIQEKKSSRLDREFWNQTKITELNNQADKMDKSAGKRLTAAILGGVAQIVGAGVSLYFSAKALNLESSVKTEAKAGLKGGSQELSKVENKMGREADKSLKVVDKRDGEREGILMDKTDANGVRKEVKAVVDDSESLLQKEAKKGAAELDVAVSDAEKQKLESALLEQETNQRILNQQQGLQMRGRAFGEIIDAVGRGGAASFTASGDHIDADAKRDETEATQADTAMQNANETMQNMAEVIADMRQRLQSMEQAQNQSVLGITRNMA